MAKKGNKRREPEDSIDMDYGPKAKTPILTLVLIVLNIVAALGFTVLLAMDYSKRQAWSYAVFKHDLGLMGLPLKEEERGPSASRVTMQRQNLDSDQLKKAFSERPQTKQGSGDFQPVTLNLSNPILPQHLTPEILNDWFRKNDWYGDVGEPVQTLENEVERLQNSLKGDIAQAAEAIAADAKSEEQKRDLLDSLLTPLAYSPHQIDVLDKKIKALPATDLDQRIKDAAQRRILVSILTPLEKHRPAPQPAEAKDRLLEQAADYDTIGLDRLYYLLDKRMEAALNPKYDPSVHFGPEWEGKTRDSIEKRNAIAFLVTAVAHARKPDKDRNLLQPNGPERAQAVLGLYEYAYAVQKLTATLIADYERVLESIRNDRDGAPFRNKSKKFERNPGFVDNYRAELTKIQDLVAAIDKSQKRLADLEGQKAEHVRIVDDREKQEKEVTDKLLKARAETFRQLAEVQKLNDQYFEAQKKLIDAQEQNLRREKELRHWESLIKKGAQP